MKERNIAIIGGGASGTVTMIYVAKIAAAKNISLAGIAFHLIDPKGFGWGGIAYGLCSPKHILNTRRNEMSPWDENSFRDFVVNKGRIDDDLHFDYRSDCNEFLKQELQEAFKIIKNKGGLIAEHNSKAFIKTKKENTFSVVDEDDTLLDPRLSTVPASDILLTVGYGPNKNFTELKEFVGKGYIHSLYPYQNIENESTLQLDHPRVAVFGSAAALYDFALVCPSKPQSTSLYIFSEGCTGAQKIRQVEIEKEFKSVDTSQLLQLTESATVDEVIETINNIFKRNQSKEVGPDTWIAFNIMLIIANVLNDLNEMTAKAFRSSRFFLQLRRLGGPTTKPADKALRSYNTTFVPHNIFPENVVRNENGSFTINAGSKSYEVDCIVNATGHGRHNSGVLEMMKADGIAIVNSKTGVLATDESGYRLIGSGIACVGPAVHFGTDGIQTFAAPAEKFVREVLTSYSE